MRRRLEGRTAIVTGAAAGLGRAIALGFAAEGAHVVACDMRTEVETSTSEVPSTVALIRGAGGAVTSVVCDVTSATEVARLVETAAGITGRLDVVVNNAGRYGGSTLLDTSEEEFDCYLDANLRSAFLVSRAAIGVMLAQDAVAGVRGRIINMASQFGITGPPAKLSYAVAKGGVVMLTRQTAVDYGPEAILVNAIAPGRILTGDHPGELEYLASGEIDEAMAFSLRRTPFGRMGRPADIAGAALYLAGDDASFVSGAVLSVDGGWTAY
jgi:NAD(P)-dependent dehydrogenase (short-subunit alcohol dehydrogenase family)